MEFSEYINLDPALYGIQTPLLQVWKKKKDSYKKLGHSL